jgi:hypothetical protein
MLIDYHELETGRRRADTRNLKPERLPKASHYAPEVADEGPMRRFVLTSEGPCHRYLNSMRIFAEQCDEPPAYEV